MDDEKKIKVLLVDDEPRFRATTARTLERRGFDVMTAANGREATRMVWRNDIDVVVLDVKMPEMDGHRALREIKALDSSVQVIMLTGYGTVDSALEGWRDEAFMYLTKPCDIETLTDAINGAYFRKTSLQRETAAHPQQFAKKKTK